MKKVKPTLIRFLYPPKPVLFIAVPFIFAALIAVFALNEAQSAIAYPIYVMSAYALTILTAALVKAVRSGIFKDNKIIRKAMSYDFTRRYLQDGIFRVDVGIYRGLIANFLYMLFRLLTGIRYGSVWFISVSVYIIWCSAYCALTLC